MKRRLQDNLKRVRERIEAACARAHRPPASVTLVGVTKYVSLEVIRVVVDAGLTDLGESRPQELIRRAAATREWLGRRRAVEGKPPLEPRWHLIGPLQRNKVAKTLPWTSLIHSVDTLRLAEDIDAQSAKLGVVTPVLLELNAADEPGKHGIAFSAAPHMVEVLSTLRNIRLCGLMAMGPNTPDESRIRFVFERMAEMFHDIRRKSGAREDFRVLSMGMSADFEFAVEAGATHVRVGSALFEGILDAPRGRERVDAAEAPS